MIEDRIRTLKQTLCKFAWLSHQREWKTNLQLTMMIYSTSDHAVRKNSTFYVQLGKPLTLPIDCTFERSNTNLFPLFVDLGFNTGRDVQRA